eukprot:4572532-Pleurochrysis_carterae.AAC.1
MRMGPLFFFVVPAESTDVVREPLSLDAAEPAKACCVGEADCGDCLVGLRAEFNESFSSLVESACSAGLANLNRLSPSGGKSSSLVRPAMSGGRRLSAAAASTAAVSTASVRAISSRIGVLSSTGFVFDLVAGICPAKQYG